jgi:hypothetical protein
MIIPALILSWMWGKKREPTPEYQSPNAWSKYFTVTGRASGLLDELEQTFDEKQMKLYEKYRETVLEADREKPWQGEYGKLFDNPNL